MADLRGFRAAVRVHLRAAGHTQQQLARSIGLHPDVLSHKLNGRDNAVLTGQDVVAIAAALTGWGALVSRTDLQALLDLMDVPPHAVPAAAWSVPPLSYLDDGEGIARTRAAPDRPEPAALSPRLALAPLPAPATSLIGRARERAVVAAALATSRLVTLTGAGGTGKTRLAVQVAWDVAGTFGDGVAFVDLAPVRDPELLAAAVARALGLAPPSAEGAEAHLAGALRDRELLVVADNLEHLLEESPLLARVLAVAPAVRVLATSRIPLRLYGEHVVRVPPLPVTAADGVLAAGSEAVQLFLARARAVRPDFAADPGDLAAIGEICAALDGLPLAIELAAARVRLYQPRALLPLLPTRLALLTGGPRDRPGRQQTLRAALDWSHALLTPAERRLFARAGVFPGPFSAAAAAAVEAEPDQARTLEYLAGLADQSLLEVTPGETPVFRMLQTVREYALARLAETGERETVRRRHLAHYLAVALTAAAELGGPRQAALLDQLEAAYPNMRAALDFAYHQGEHDDGCLGDGLRLAAALSTLWQRRRSLAEGIFQLDRLLALDDERQHPAGPRVRASAVLGLCALACFQGDHRRTAELAWQAIGLCEPVADHLGLARAHRFLGEAVLASGDGAGADPHFRSQLAEASKAGHLSGQADAYNMLGQAARHQGEFRRARSLLWQGLKFFRLAGDVDGISVILSSLGEVARDAGQADPARRLFTAALRRHAALGNKRQMAFELGGLAAAAGLLRSGREALVFLGAAQALQEETGSPPAPAEQAILDRILAPALAALPASERRDALSQGRNRPLADIVGMALAR
ncbi:MAG: ATP-binding protein [Streptosporangiaceae bacterium]